MPIENVNKDIYIDNLLECLKKDLVLNSTIKKIYPSEFVLDNFFSYCLFLKIWP